MMHSPILPPGGIRRPYCHELVYPASPENCPGLASGLLNEILLSPYFTSTTRGDIAAACRSAGETYEAPYGRLLVWEIIPFQKIHHCWGKPENNAVYAVIQEDFVDTPAIHIGRNTSGAYAFHALSVIEQLLNKGEASK